MLSSLDRKIIGPIVQFRFKYSVPTEKVVYSLSMDFAACQVSFWLIVSGYSFLKKTCKCLCSYHELERRRFGSCPRCQNIVQNLMLICFRRLCLFLRDTTFGWMFSCFRREAGSWEAVRILNKAEIPTNFSSESFTSIFDCVSINFEMFRHKV